jgi:hypothetical protein
VNRPLTRVVCNDPRHPIDHEQVFITTLMDARSEPYGLTDEERRERHEEHERITARVLPGLREPQPWQPTIGDRWRARIWFSSRAHDPGRLAWATVRDTRDGRLFEIRCSQCPRCAQLSDTTIELVLDTLYPHVAADEDGTRTVTLAMIERFDELLS